MRLTRMKRIGLLILLSAAVAAAQEFTLRVSVSLVSVDVGVFDRKGESITTLGRDDFLVYEDGVQQKIRAFEPSGVAFSALLVVDRSGSMRPMWESVVNALNRFMEVLRVQDRVAIAAFDSGVEMVSDWRSAHSGRKQQIGMMADGRGTDFFGAVDWAAAYIRGEKGRKGVVVFSDGDQQFSGRVDYKKALERVRQSNVPFYFVGTSSRNDGAKYMNEMAEISGGRAFYPRVPEDMVGVYEQIGRDLGRAYSITYESEKAPDGKFRKIEVRPIDVRLHISQSRDGYYAR